MLYQNLVSEYLSSILPEEADWAVQSAEFNGDILSHLHVWYKGVKIVGPMKEVLEAVEKLSK